MKSLFPASGKRINLIPGAKGLLSGVADQTATKDEWWVEKGSFVSILLERKVYPYAFFFLMKR